MKKNKEKLSEWQEYKLQKLFWNKRVIYWKNKQQGSSYILAKYIVNFLLEGKDCKVLVPNSRMADAFYLSLDQELKNRKIFFKTRIKHILTINKNEIHIVEEDRAVRTKGRSFDLIVLTEAWMYSNIEEVFITTMNELRKDGEYIIEFTPPEDKQILFELYDKWNSVSEN